MLEWQASLPLPRDLLHLQQHSATVITVIERTLKSAAMVMAAVITNPVDSSDPVARMI